MLSEVGRVVIQDNSRCPPLASKKQYFMGTQIGPPGGDRERHTDGQSCYFDMSTCRPLSVSEGSMHFAKIASLGVGGVYNFAIVTDHQALSLLLVRCCEDTFF